MELMIREPPQDLPFGQLLGETLEEWQALEDAAAAGDLSCGLGVPALARLRALAARLGWPVRRAVKTLDERLARS